MQRVGGKLKSYLNPDYRVGVCVFLLSYMHLVLVFIALDNSAVHMCLHVVVDQIMLLPSNQMEWILVYY